MMNLLTEVGLWMKEEMEISELSNSALANEVGVNRSTVSRWLKGQTFPSPSAFKQMVSLFDAEIKEVDFFSEATFAEKLFLLRCADGLEVKDVAEGLMYNERLIRKWEQGKQLPNDMQILRIARYYDVTSEDLGIEITPTTFGSRLQEERSASNLTQAELGSYIGQSAATISNFENNKQTPTMDELNVISMVLQVPIEALIVDEDDLPFEDFAIYFLRLKREAMKVKAVV